MNISIAVAVKDEPEAWRKKRGDIIAVKPGGWQWGSGEVSKYIILEISIQFTKNIMSVLQTIYYEGGVIDPDPMSETVVVSKRLFKIEWDALKTEVATKGVSVDWESVEDGDIAYQPLSSQQEAPGGVSTLLNPLNIIWSKYNNRIISASDINKWE